MSIERFLEPRLVGPRFEGHAIPLEFLKDLAVLEEMIIEVAKAEFLKSNSGRKRSPRGFTDGVSFKLTGVEEGSARPVISLVIASTSLFGSDSQGYFEKARDSIVNAISAAEQNGPVSSFLPPETLSYFDRLGRSLRAGEAMEFARPGGAPARLTPQARRTLVLAAPNVQTITDEAERRGTVVDTNDTAHTFTIRLPSGQEIVAPLAREHRDVILDAQKEAPRGIRVAIRGIGQFNRAQKLINFESVEEVTPLEARDVPARLDELRLLKDGWLEGSGKAPEHEAMDRLAELFTMHYPDELPLPYTYPTEAGGIQLEWHIGAVAPEVEIDLSTMRGDWRVFDSARNIDEEARIDMATPEGWADLAQRIDVLAGHGQKTGGGALGGRA